MTRLPYTSAMVCLLAAGCQAGASNVEPSITFSTVPPATLVHIKDLSADGSVVNRSGDITIAPRRQRIVLAFTGLSLSAHEAAYTNLSRGAYRFRVIASNSEGAWNSAEASLPFTISPAWRQTAWFWFSAALLLSGAVWAAYRVRVAQVSRQLNVRFEERLAERTRIARELHDTLLQSFQSVLLRFRSVSYLLPDRPAEARTALESAIDQARHAIVEGRDAVRGLRFPGGETQDIASAIGTLGATLAADHADQNVPDVRVNMEGTPRNLAPLLRDEVYRIAGEALRNAFRHAHAARIEVEILYDHRQFRLRVRDDGKGIDSNVVGGGNHAGHYGLAGMHERATLVGGKLAVWSERDSGTEAELIIPASVAYAKSPATVRSDVSRTGKMTNV